MYLITHIIVIILLTMHWFLSTVTSLGPLYFFFFLNEPPPPEFSPFPHPAVFPLSRRNPRRGEAETRFHPFFFGIPGGARAGAAPPPPLRPAGPRSTGKTRRHGRAAGAARPG